MSQSRKPILRGHQMLNTTLPSPVAEKIKTLTDYASVYCEYREIHPEERHYIHYKRRMDAVDAGVQHLLNSMNLEEDKRAALEKDLGQYKTECSQALTKENEAHRERQDAEKETLSAEKKQSDELTIRLAEINKGKPLAEEEKQALLTKDKFSKRHQEKIDRVEADPGSITPYQNHLADYLSKVKKALEEQAGIPKQKIKKALSRAEDYAILAEGKPPLCTVTRLPDVKGHEKQWMIQLEQPLDPLSEAKKQELLNAVKLLRSDQGTTGKLPRWYEIMPKSEQQLFFETFKKAQTTKDIAKIVPSISSKLRSIPGVANFSRHTFMVINEEGTLISQSTRLRSSMVASRDISKKETDLRHDLTISNIEQVIQAGVTEQVTALEHKTADSKQKPAESEVITIPFLMQTLITPANLAGPDRRLLHDKDKAIAELREKYKDPTTMVINGQTVKVKIELISTNHPLNPGRYLTPTGRATPVKIRGKTKAYDVSGKTAKEDVQLIMMARKYAGKHTSNKDIGKIADALEKALALPASIADREIYISALEELAVSQMGGIGYGSCVSGKDRKGLETIYTDAMQLYLNRYHELPPSSAEKNTRARKNFVAIFTEIYSTRHQHENAGQNAPGADGIKTPEGYLPNDILRAIQVRTKNPDIHKQCDRLASNNELSKIKHKVPNKIKKVLGSSIKTILKLLHLTGSKKKLAPAPEGTELSTIVTRDTKDEPAKPLDQTVDSDMSATIKPRVPR